MKRILLFDTEDGSKTLGGESRVQKMLGLPPLKIDTWDNFYSTIGQLYEDRTFTVNKDIAGINIVETQHKKVLKENVEIDGIVIDTFSELSKKLQRKIVGTRPGMQMQDWGKLKMQLDDLLERLMRIPGVIILTCHTKIQSMDEGNEEIPYIDGSTKDDISKWFDFVFYTFTKKEKGKDVYMWRTRHTPRYANAKDRTDLLDDAIPQDYQLVLDVAKKKGFDNCKILILGKPGTGKTKSLSTLIKGETNGN